MQQKARRLVQINKVAFWLHFVSFVGALILSIIYAGKSYKTQVTLDFNATLESRGFYPIIWVDLPFPLITAIFHGIIAFVPSVRSDYLKNVLQQHMNPLRWIEYSITASLMTWVIMQLSGVTNVFLLILGGIVANIALQAMGYLADRRIRIATPLGWLIFVAQWSVIMAYFFTTVQQAGAPWFVYSIIIGLFVMFASFGMVQLCIKDAYKQEIGFLSLSFIAKFFLTWNLLIGIFTRN